MDSQTIEILGRNRLVNELLIAGIEVATPMRDRGVDLIAYIDLVDQATNFIAVPIQMKAASKRSFMVDAKYEKISNLILAFVWGLREENFSQTYALTYFESIEIAKEMGWTKTRAWVNGSYSTNAPSYKLCELLKPYLMSPLLWRNKLSLVSKVSL